MYITFDSSILISDYYLSSKIAELFFENHEMCGYKLLISNVAIEETINKFSEEIKKFNELNKRNLQFIPKEYLNYIPLNVVENLANNYRNFLNNKFTYSSEKQNKSRSTRFYNYQNVNLENIFNKALLKKNLFVIMKKDFAMH